MRTLAWSALALVCILLSGCALFGSKKSKQDEMDYSYPPDILQLCVQAREDAKNRINALGIPLNVVVGQKVIKHKGEKKFGTMWAWYDSRWKFYVGGLTGGYKGSVTEVGCNPDTGGEVDYGLLVHENGHYWLISNYRDASHDAKYDSAFHWGGMAMMLPSDQKSNQKGLDSLKVEHPNGGFDFVVLKENGEISEHYRVLGW